MKCYYQVLMIDDDQSIHEFVKDTISSTQYSRYIRLVSAFDGQVGLDYIKSYPINVAFIDQKLPHRSGLSILENISQLGLYNLDVIMMSGQNSIQNAITSLKLGAKDFLIKPIDFKNLKKRIENLYENYQNFQSKYSFQKSSLIGKSPAIQDIIQQLHKISSSNISVLILGESGTGKELIAKAIHQFSNRCNQPFIAINCGAIPRELLESELFGHERGAFTGAAYKKTGYFQQADGGTLFLDEIGDLDLELQVKLLRVLQEKEIQPIGSSKKIKVDARIISATHRDLQSYMEKKLFREDLFFRLNVFPIFIPPLRDRKDDISLLAQYFLSQSQKKYNLKKPKSFSQQAIKQLTSYSWKGNVRELKNLVERICLTLDHHDEVQLIPDHMFQFKLNSKIIHSVFPIPSQPNSQQQQQQNVFTLAKVEEITIQNALKHFKYNILRTSQALKIGRDTLYRKMKLYNIKNPIRS